MKSGIVFYMVMAALLTSLVFSGDRLPRTGEDEIRVIIQLDLKEDIGLLLIDHDVNGTTGTGGISNANKSMLRRDSKDYWTIDKQFVEHPADTVSVTLRFRVVTEYFDPNYDNIYPEEYVEPMDAVSFTAEFGKSYSVTITGDRVNGYHAVLEDP